MAKVTSKYQVTLPKALADQYKIRPGDDIAWVAAGEVIRVIPAGAPAVGDDRESRLRLFDMATERQRRRAPRNRYPKRPSRGWKREDLYRRGRTH